MQWSRGLEAFAKMVRNALPRLDYQACYFAKVVKFDSTRQQVDLEPDDARLPTLQGVPFRGPPGTAWELDESSKPTVLVTWENGDPSRPVAFGAGLARGSAGAHVLKATWTADLLELGAAGGEPPPRGQSLNNALINDFLATLASKCTGVATLGQVAAAINAIGPAAQALINALPGTLAQKVTVT